MIQGNGYEGNALQMAISGECGNIMNQLDLRRQELIFRLQPHREKLQLTEPQRLAFKLAYAWTVASQKQEDLRSLEEDQPWVIEDWFNSQKSDALHQAILNNKSGSIHMFTYHQRSLDDFSVPPTKENRFRTFTALQIATMADKKQYVDDLLAGGADPNRHHQDGPTALHIAVVLGRNEIFTRLLTCPKTDVNIGTIMTLKTVTANMDELGVPYRPFRFLQTSDNETILTRRSALHLAVDSGNDWVLEKLLQHPKLDVNTQAGVEGPTALHMAVDQGKAKMVKILLDAQTININHQYRQPNQGASESLTHGKLTTSLDLAVVRPNNQDVLHEILKQPGLKVNMQNNLGETALHHATDPDIIRKLLEIEALDPNVCSMTGRSPLWTATAAGDDQKVVLLLKDKRFRLNWKDISGNSIIYIAADQGFESICRHLLDNHLVSNCEVEYCKTIQEWYTRNEQSDSNDMAIRKTALFIAAVGGHRKIVVLLRDLLADKIDTAIIIKIIVEGCKTSLKDAASKLSILQDTHKRFSKDSGQHFSTFVNQALEKIEKELKSVIEVETERCMVMNLR
ncbi:ankyrin repeat-containing domain protein [Flagelloscypha sp. PMI_526]|nr:ankyrin repeat-containing domain protein [Flagelloscypha sp. PMI_526]